MSLNDFRRKASTAVYIPALDTAEEALRSFSPGTRALFLFFAGLMFVSTAGLLYLLEDRIVVAVPARGGSLSEGIIGTPRFINPVLALSDADRDLTNLVYSGLLRATPDGSYIPDLAIAYDVSPDGKTYTVHLRPNATFQDGSSVTADDVVFTVVKTQDSALKSPARADWDGVAVEAVDERTVRFTLKAPYAPFVENLTFGILPKHLWESVGDDEFPFSDLNTTPVGSGPFRVGGISRSAGGIPSSYDLKPFAGYTLGEPYLGDLTLHFYSGEAQVVAAIGSGEIQAASGLSPASLSGLTGFEVRQAPLNRVFAVFFNQNQSEVLRDAGVRRALGDAIDRNDLIQQVLGGYGTPLTGPVPPTFLWASAPAASTSSGTDLAAAAQQELLNKGWKLGTDGILTKTTGAGKSARSQTLSFSLSTGNVPELRAAAEYLRTAWQKIGANVDIKIFDQGDLSQNVIRPRRYDALLFGQVIGRELDLYPFWDSSQRNDPGLNVALYANPTADKLLAQLRATGQGNERIALYQRFQAELQKDLPALFLYAPDFVYTVPKDLQGFYLGLIETPSDRFLSVASWHREIDYVWPFFVDAKNEI